MTKTVKIFTYFAIAGTLASAFLFYSKAQAASSAQITATVAVGVCGNNIVEWGEQCDGSALDGETCLSLGYDGGTLSCNVGCNFDVSECVDLGPDEGSIVFSGTAYPQSVVRILKDGQIAATTAGDDNGNFETTLSDLTVGSYIFSVYAYDSNGQKSKTLTYQEDIIKNEIQEISDIIVPPTLSADRNDVPQSEIITFSGQSAASSPVTIFFESGGGNFSHNTISNSYGFFSYMLDTDALSPGDFTTWAKTEIDSLLSVSSENVYFHVSALPPSPPPPPTGRTIILDSIDLTRWKCVFRTTKRKPVFTGTTNISEAVVKIEIRTRKNKRRIITQTRANADGRWTWKNPVRLKRKNYIIQITLIDPSDSSRYFSYSQPFKLIKKIKRSTRRKCQTTAVIPAANSPGKVSPLSETAFSGSADMKRADLNGDSRVNLIDASIFTDRLKRNDFSPEMDMNNDGKIDLSDFSILMYYWTG